MAFVTVLYEKSVLSVAVSRSSVSLLIYSMSYSTIGGLLGFLLLGLDVFSLQSILNSLSLYFYSIWRPRQWYKAPALYHFSFLGILACGRSLP